MTRKTFRATLLGGIALMLLANALLIGWLFSAGAVHLHVEGRGQRPLHLVVPGAFLEAGLWLLPDAALAETDAADPAWRPLAAAACAALADCPEGEFVRIETAAERVIIAKTRRHLLLHVDSADERLRLEIPLRNLRGLGRQLAAI